MSAEIKLAKSSLFLSAFLWGFGFVAVEGALISGWDPMALLAARGFIGGSLLFIFSYRRKFWKNKELMIEGIKAGFFLTLGFRWSNLWSSIIWSCKRIIHHCDVCNICSYHRSTLV
jgi:drug/metabolite transporter (DMT)-like permease